MINKDNIAYIVLALGLFIPQFLLTNYVLVIISWVITGYCLSIFYDMKGVFVKTLLLELFFSCALYLMAKGNIGFLENIMAAVNMPKALLAVVFILFNMLNAAIVVNAGSILATIVRKKQ